MRGQNDGVREELGFWIVKLHRCRVGEDRERERVLHSIA